MFKAHHVVLLILLPVLGVVPAMAADLALEEILARHYEAIGGLEAWSALDSVRMTGTMTLTETVEAPVVISAKRPRKYRLEFEYRAESNITAYDGETAWVLLPSVLQLSPQRLDDGGTRSLWEMADFDGLLVHYEEEGGSLELVGSEELDGAPAYRLELTLKTGAVREIDVDAESFLVRRVAGTYEAGGATGRISRTYGDYRVVNGVLMAHAIEEFTESAGVTRPTRVETVEFNVELDDALFAQPAAVETAAGDQAGDGH